MDRRNWEGLHSRREIELRWAVLFHIEHEHLTGDERMTFVVTKNDTGERIIP